MVVNYFLNTKYISSNFKVPNAIVDEFILSADGNALKVLLIILRNTFEIPTIEQLSISSGLSIESVKQALKFWQENNIICITDNTPKTNHWKNYKPEFLSPVTIKQLSEDNQNIRDILSVAQNISGNRQLSPYEMSSLISAYNYLDMPKDVILALFSDCRLNNKSINFFDTTISNWARLGVKSLDDATAQLNTERYLRQVMDIFRLKSLLPSQKECVNYWHDNDYPLEIVQYLFNKYDALDKNQPPNAPKKTLANVFYINKIIQNLIENKITTVDALRQYEQSHSLDAPAKNGNYNQRKSTAQQIETNYDLEEYRTFIHSTKRIMHD